MAISSTTLSMAERALKDFAWILALHRNAQDNGPLDQAPRKREDGTVHQVPAFDEQVEKAQLAHITAFIASAQSMRRQLVVARSGNTPIRPEDLQLGFVLDATVAALEPLSSRNLKGKTAAEVDALEVQSRTTIGEWLSFWDVHAPGEQLSRPKLDKAWTSLSDDFAGDTDELPASVRWISAAKGPVVAAQELLARVGLGSIRRLADLWVHYNPELDESNGEPDQDFSAWGQMAIERREARNYLLRLFRFTPDAIDAALAAPDPFELPATIDMPW